MPRPHVTTRCVADTYANKTCERIVEFGTTGKQAGGLISIRNHDDGTTSVHVYRTDPGVAAQPSIVNALHRLVTVAQGAGWLRHEGDALEQAERELRHLGITAPWTNQEAIT